MQRVGLLARASTAVCSGVLGAGRAGDCAASTSYAQSLPWTQSWQAQPCRPSTALTTSSSSSSSSVAAVTKSLLVDTLALMRRFEKQGMSRQQAEAMAEHMTELICVNREKIVEQFISKAALEKAVLEQEARIAGFRSEVSKSQELHLASVTRDIERLSNQLEKIRSEIRYEVDKLTSSQRLDLNLEKNRIRDDINLERNRVRDGLQGMRDKANELEIKMDKEVNMLRAAVEQSKNEVIKWSLGLLLGVGSIGIALARLFL